MNYVVTLNGKNYEVEVTECDAVLLNVSDAVAAKTAERSDAVQRGQSPWKAAFQSRPPFLKALFYRKLFAHFSSLQERK